MDKEKLLLIPGPSPVHPRIIHSLSLPTVSHVSPVFVAELKEALINLKNIVFCENGEPFIIAGAGTLAMEMALLNTVERGESVLVLSQGFFGQRMAAIAQSFGIDCDIIQSPWGKAVSPSELREKLAEKNYAAVSSTHVDTATGAAAPVKDYAGILKDQNSLFFIDGVCATGGMEEKMTDWGVDVILTAAQKCFGVPPGLAILVLSEKAMAKRNQMPLIPAYYADLMRWLPIMKDPSKYFSTPCVNEIRAFNESTKIILEEGLDVRFIRHHKTARAIREALKGLGFSFFTEEPFLADTLSVVLYPEGIEDQPFRSKLAENGVIVAGGLGEVAGKVFRMGHMGNLSLSQIYFAIQAVEKTLTSMNYAFEPKIALNAARNIMEKE
ncbi:MAG: alanine--glyoxylate aminotransferase family protein [Candidatus Aminicenantes bacterium]|nr:alanine--glyoxylate aminotransferase family protein [Candidatus Aminicenantes bacterium]